MKTTVFLVRHGEIDNPRKIIYGRNVNLKLSDKGKDQVNQLAKKLKSLGYKIDKIYSSPLLRAIQTAEILGKTLGVKFIETKAGFTDDDMPGLAGKPLTLLSMFSPTGMDQYSKEYLELGNESRIKVIRGIKKAFIEILNKNKGKTIMVVSHGNPIFFLLFYLTNPLRRIPPMEIIYKNYPQKGSAVRLIVEDEKVLDKEYIS